MTSVAIMLSVVVLSVTIVFSVVYDECSNYAECRRAECRGLLILIFQHFQLLSKCKNTLSFYFSLLSSLFLAPKFFYCAALSVGNFVQYCRNDLIYIGPNSSILIGPLECVVRSMNTKMDH